MRVLLISLGALLVTGMLLLMTRLWGQGQVYQAYSHPFIESPKPWQAVQISDLETAKKLVSQKKDVIFWLNLAVTKDGHFLVFDPNKPLVITRELFQDKFRSQKTQHYELSTLRLFFDKEPLVDEFIDQFPDIRKILVINDNASEVHQAVVNLVEKHKAYQNLMLQSDAEIILKSIKTEKPLWLFGTSRSDLMRLMTFDSVGLVVASPFYGDVFVAPFTVLNRPAFNESVLEEMRRRKKTIMLGPLKESEIESAKSLKPDGYIYETLELFERELDQDLAQ